MRKLAAVVALMVSGTALALPWDIDMADSQAVKAYEAPMGSPAVGSVAQPSELTPDGFSPNFIRGSAEGEALTMPEMDAAGLVLGKKMYDIYCTPCHGDGAKLGPVAEPGRFAGVATLSGPLGTAHTRTDGWLYLSVRNGGTLMPSYGWAMTDHEMWAVVAHVRTLPNAAWVAPTAAAPETP